MLELNPIEEFDILSELQFPDYIFSIDSIEEQIIFSNYITSLSGRRILLLHDSILNLPFVLAGLKENQIETIIKDGGYNFKKTLFSNLSNPDIFNEILKFIKELDQKNKTTENSARFRNIMQYLRDNKFII